MSVPALLRWRTQQPRVFFHYPSSSGCLATFGTVHTIWVARCRHMLYPCNEPRPVNRFLEPGDNAQVFVSLLHRSRPGHNHTLALQASRRRLLATFVRKARSALNALTTELFTTLGMIALAGGRPPCVFNTSMSCPKAGHSAEYINMPENTHAKARWQGLAGRGT